MSKEQELVELFERAHGPLNPARPEDSFLHSEADLEKGREQARVAADAFPEFKLAADVARDFAADRYPEMGGVVELLRMGVEEHPGLIPGPVGDPALWTQVGALDRASGRLIYAGQLIQGGGEAGALTVGAAANGLCEGAAQRAADLIAAPGTADNVRSLVRSAFCEPFRLLTDQRDREAQQQKVKDEGTRPLQDQIDKTAERAALTRAIEAFLSTQGAGS